MGRREKEVKLVKEILERFDEVILLRFDLTTEVVPKNYSTKLILEVD